MFTYKCHVCGGLCDPGELENGVCFDCRSAAVERKEEQNHRTVVEIRRMVGVIRALEEGQKATVGGGVNG